MPARRLYRSRTEKKIAGVCGGIAEHFDLDPVLVRLATVALTFVLPPFTTVGYLACWLIVPLEPEPEMRAGARAEAGATPTASGQSPASAAAAGSRLDLDGSIIGGIIFVTLGIFFLLLNLGVIPWHLLKFWRWRVVWPLVLIVLGILMLIRSLRATQGRQREG